MGGLDRNIRISAWSRRGAVFTCTLLAACLLPSTALVCRAGQQGNALGTECVPCPQGTFKPSTNDSPCSPCPLIGAFSPAGSIESSACVGGETAPKVCSGGSAGLDESAAFWCPLDRSTDLLWCGLPTSPAAKARHGHSLVAVDEFVIMYGGLVYPDVGYESWGEVDNMAYALDTNLPRLTWKSVGTTSQEVPAGRLFHSAVVMQHAMVVFGGTTPSPAPWADLSSPWMLDLTALTWSKVPVGNGGPAAATGRWYGHAAAVSVDGARMLVYGGMGADNATACSDQVWALSAGTWEWARLTTSGSSPGGLCWHSAIMSGSSMVLVGGYAGPDLAAASTNVWVLDTDLLQWSGISTSAELPASITGAVMHMGAVLVFSGACQAGPGCSVSSLDLGTGQFEAAAVAGGEPVPGEVNATAAVGGMAQKMVSTVTGVFVLGGASRTGFSAYALRSLHAPLAMPMLGLESSIEVAGSDGIPGFDAFDNLLGGSSGALSFDISEILHPSGTRGSKQEFPAARERFAMVVVGDKVALFGGASSEHTDVGETAFTIWDDTWVLDRATATWTALQGPAPTPGARQGHSMVTATTSAGTLAYMFGGASGFVSPSSWLRCSGCSAAQLATEGYLAMNETWVLDVGAGAWSMVPATTVPGNREGHAAVVRGGAMIVHGGVDFGRASTSNRRFRGRQYGDVWALTLSSQTWSRVTTSGGGPGEIFHHAAVVSGGSILVSGGVRLGLDGTLHFHDDLWELSAGYAWRKIAVAGSEATRAGHTAVMVGSSMLLFGGYAIDRSLCSPETNQTAACVVSLGDTVKAVPATGSFEFQFTEVFSANPPQPRRHHAGVMTGPDLFIMGGADEWVSDGARWMQQFPDSAYLAISAVVPRSGSMSTAPAGMYLALATDFQTVMLPEEVAFSGATLYAAEVLVEPYMTSLAGEARLLLGEARTLLCDAADGCDSLALHRVAAAPEAGAGPAAASFLQAVGSQVSVAWSAFSQLACNASGCAASATAGASVEMYGVAFAGCEGASGGALAAVGGAVSVTQCEFTSNGAAGAGGAILVAGVGSPELGQEGVDYAATLSVLNSSFTGNAAGGGGGAVSCELGATCEFAGSTFGSNAALASSSGGALRVISATAVSVATCSFSDNAATGGAGGAIFWQGQQPLQADVPEHGALCTFSSDPADAALYGPCVATNPVGVAISNSSARTVEYADVYPGLQLEPHPSVRVVDWYNQSATISGGPMTANLYVRDTFSAILQGVTAVAQDAATLSFEFYDAWLLAGLTGYDQAAGSVAWRSTIDLGFLVHDPYTGTELPSPTLSVSLHAGICPAGHTLQVSEWNLTDISGGSDGDLYGACSRCPPTTYTLAPLNGQPSCEPCPAGARCPGGDAIEGVGEWVRDGDSYKLVSCPHGYSLVEGSSAAEQQCRECNRDGLEYILHPNSSPCQRCPPGLRCVGDKRYTPVVNGSNWTRVGDQLRLQACPANYFRVVEEGVTRERCEPCPAGTECLGGGCETCVLCPAGKFKDAAGVHACAPCPRNTYNPAAGADSVSACLPCQSSSAGVREGAASIDACECEQTLYRAGNSTCAICPAGARCLDGSCALARPGLACGDNSSVVGDWERGEDGQFVLTSCPDGYERRDAAEVGIDEQYCHKCHPATQYVVFPNNGTCQPCPEGLECAGVLAATPVVENSTWTLVDGIYTLQRCPAHYYLFAGGGDVTAQACLPCPAGQDCVGGGCAEGACNNCDPGTYKDFASPTQCVNCPRATYNPDPAATSRSQCVACPGGAVTAEDRQADAAACVCGAEFYLQDGSAQAGGDVLCVVCPTGALCPTGTCAFAVSDNRTCPGVGEPVVGDWELADDGTYVLLGCPEGYALINSTTGTSQGEFLASIQQCKECNALNEYVLDPNKHQCTACPPGLECFGNSTVNIRLPDSEWSIVNGTYILDYCPPGYYRENDELDAQECRICGLGVTCAAGGCDDCTPCPPGTYKSISGLGDCLECPKDTFSTSETAFECTACPVGATTNSTAEDSVFDCVCDAVFYASYTETASLLCNQCPPGALCLNGDCALRPELNLTCSDGSTVVGEWERGEDDRFRVLSCPAGYSLVNSSDGTSRGEFAHDLQQCKKCTASEYILRPNLDTCQRCPPGLLCDGTAAVSEALNGSLWNITESEDGELVYTLESCPTGYEKAGSRVELEQCVPCPAGTQCVEDVCTQCAPCPAGTYKENSGAFACAPCPEHTFGPDDGATSLRQCRTCPRYAYTDGDGKTEASACACDGRYYFLDGPETCSICPVGATCADLSCALAQPGFACPDGAGILGNWTKDDEGSYRLRSCPAGTTLVNSTVGTQEGVFFHEGQRCKPCDTVGEYIISPDTHQCQKCPPGLVCGGDAHVEPVVDSSWKVVDDYWYLVNCSAGYYPFRGAAGFIASIQQCQPCGVGEFCDAGCQGCSACAPGSYKDSASTLPCTLCPSNTYNPAAGATDRTDCLACPSGATTEGVGEVEVTACTCSVYTYRRAVNETTECMSCPAGAVCSSGACAFAEDAGQCPDRDSLVGTWVVDEDGYYKLARCPPQHELVNTLPGGVFDLDVQHCKACRSGLEYVVNPNTDQCQACPLGLECIGNADPADAFRVVSEGDLDPASSGARNASAWIRPLVEGSVWEAQGSQWVLVSCPTGYFVDNDSAETQQCTPCPAGRQCTDTVCTECSLCPVGTYKGTSGAYHCIPCPVGTYYGEEGAEALTTCIECPVGSTTIQGGSTSYGNCTCGAREYTILEPAPFSCQECPLGATCPDDTCAFNLYVFEEDGSLAELPGNSGLQQVRGHDGRGPRCIPNANPNSVANARCFEEPWFNFTCKGGRIVVGDWARGADGRYTLVSCPDGYSLVNSTSGTSSGAFAEASQHCKQCRDWEYIVNPNTDQCQQCPTGLVCDGTKATVPRTEGAEWVVDGDVYKLVSCPTGYRLFDNTPLTQQCVPCDIGTQCTTAECTDCEACPLGTYKEGSGPYACFDCPVGTYYGSDQIGATSADVCISCPTFSTTDGPAMTSKYACRCNEYTYLIDTADDFSCEACPVGAMCPDDSCALRNAMQQCPDGTTITGSWVLNDETGQYQLQSCPAGHSLVNKSADGSFFHDGQQCVACLADQYILSPNTDECQPCPPGLVCDGSSVTTPRTSGAEWAEDGAIMRLISCPSGYSVYTGPFESVFAAAVQQCIPCGPGQECTEARCTQCSPCAPGQYKDFVGTDACRSCPINTYAPLQGTTTVCIDCPDGSTTNGLTGQTDPLSCICEDRTYITFDPQVGPICSKCPIGGLCPDETCAFQTGTTTCPDGTNVTGTWIQDDTSLWRVTSCPEGHSLINSTHGTSYGWFSNAAQHCKKCHEETKYILNPNTDSCQTCPTGLQCNGGSEVEVRTPGSSWAIEDRPRDDRWVLQACPSGYEVHSPNLLVQECRPCDMGSHCPGINGTANCTACTLCPVGHYKDSAGTYDCQKCPIDTYCPIIGARDVTECRACPDGAFTASNGQSELAACVCSRERYGLMLDDGSLVCQECPKGAQCFDGTCALGNNHSCGSDEEFVGTWELNGEGTEYLLTSCPAGYSLVNSTAGTSKGEFSPNVQHCRACHVSTEYIINPNTDQCQTCPLGLVCNGTGGVISRTPGANWVLQDGDTGEQWVLDSCGTGYQTVNAEDNIDFARCEVCGVGEECAETRCTQCTPCREGTYKPTASGSLCTPCPLNRYNPDVGATAFTQCRECPDESFTVAVGAFERDNCTCLLSSYQAYPEGAEWTCAPCPTGARCLDGSCAFSRSPASCPSQSDVPLGDWRKDPATDEWVLRSCPDATQLVNSSSGTSAGDFLATVQQCLACTDSEYILDPNKDQCQPCPLGLLCDGGKEVVPRTPNSTWIMEDAIWKLLSCATGHYLVDSGLDGVFDELAQRCEACELGEECVQEQCTECSPCVAGTYKDAKSPESCIPCGPNSYNPSAASKTAEDCIPCPTGASTPGPGQISRDACACSSFTYTAFDQNDVMRCRTCPEGAKCLDQSCGLANPAQLCNEVGGDEPVVGTWVRDENEEYKLTSCPDGHRLINGTGGASGAFQHDLQACERCPRNSYLLSMLFECKTCPPGLSCNGTRYTQPMITGSEWEQVGEDLVLTQCPTGYKRIGPDLDDLANAQNFEFLQQQCVPCGLGEECKLGSCVECSPCLAGTYKDSVGPMECTPCPLHRYGLTNGSTSLSDCLSCPLNAVTVGLGSNDKEDCACELSTYETAATATSITCKECPAGGLCPGSICAFRSDPPTCDGEPIPGDWQPDENGDQYLKSCPEGYSLQNTTINGNFEYGAQRCVECLPSQYVLEPNAHECQTCPLGFKCFGNSTIINRVPGSVWEQDGPEFKLKTCPTGYRLLNETIPTQICDPCPLGYECLSNPCFTCTPCKPGYFKDTKSDTACIICPKDTYNSEVAGTNFANCERCPEGASTLNQGEVSEAACFCDNETYPMNFDDGSLRCRTCPAGGVCDDGSCALRLESRRCPDGSTVVGEWNQDFDNVTNLKGEFKVQSCPMGYSRMTALDGTSTGDYFHDAQQCVKCQGEREYIINPDTSTCMRCPPGLHCDGSDRVVPVINGSEWQQDGDIYRLLWCPQGYSVWDGTDGGRGVFDQQAQECLECPKGETCPSDQCTECTPCLAGSYKDVIGPELCVNCLEGYFSSTVGATTIAQCNACPKYSYTEDAGATNLSQCICVDYLYRVAEPGKDTVCKTCPAGAVCAEDNRQCALRDSSLSCPTTGVILGTWERDSATDLYILKWCPRGTQMMNSTEGTSTGPFSHEIQRCQPCQTCSDDSGGANAWCTNSQYNIDPNKYQCQTCPDGAECNGDELRTGENLDTLGALWKPDAEGKLWLANCPTGYRMRNDTGYEHQKCEKCPIGEYIFRSDDPTFFCYPCPDGAICVNGGPPTFGIEPVASTVTVVGLGDFNDTDAFDDQAKTTLIKALEDITGFPEGTIEITEACLDREGVLFCIDFINPPTAPTDTNTGRRALSQREFDTAMYRWNVRTKAEEHLHLRRQLLQSATPTGQWQVNFRAIVPGVSPVEVAKNLTSSDFSEKLLESVKRLEPEVFADLDIQQDLNATDLAGLPNSRGEVYIVQPDGRAELIWCGNGYLLVNDTFNLRKCQDCKPTSYSLHPLDHCNTIESEGHCLLRQCTRCPRGAFCSGNNNFEPQVGSEWEVVYDELLPAYLYRVKKCNIGRALVRLFNQSQEDECVPCPFGSYAFEATEYGDEWLQPFDPDRLIGDMLCLRCPRGGRCEGATAVKPVEGYWRGQNMICPTDKVDKYHRSHAWNCRQYPGAQQLGTDEDGTSWRLRAMIYRCRRGHCMENITSDAYQELTGLSDNVTRRSDRRADISVNFCRAGHEGPLCGVCKRGWAMTGRYCAICDGSFDKYRDMLLAFIIVFVIVMTYAAAWRPLMNDWEDVLRRWIKKKLENREEHPTPTILHHIHGWFHASLTDFLKIYISFFQVSGGFMTQVNVEWPNVLDDIFIVATSIVQIDVFTFPGLSCALRDIQYREKLIIMTLMVPTILFFLSVPSLFAHCVPHFRHKREECKSQFFYSAIFFIFITYGSTSRVVFDAYACHDLGVDGQWLRSEPGVICPQNDPDSLTFWWAVLCTFVYPLGIPVLLWSLLILHGVPKTVEAKQERSYLSAILEHFMEQNAIPEKITEKLLEDEVKNNLDDAKQHREMVEVSVICSKHLPKMDVWGTIDPYVVLRLGDVQKRTREIFDSDYEPVWGNDDEGNPIKEDPMDPLKTITKGHAMYDMAQPAGEKFMFPLYDGVTQDLEVRCMDWDFGALNPDDEVGTGWVTNEELRQLREEEGKVERKVVLELDGEAVKNGADGKGEDAFVLLKLRKVKPEEMQEELDRMTRLRKLLAFIGINYGDQVGQLSTKEQNEKIKKLYDLRHKEANSRELTEDHLKNKALWAELEKEWRGENKNVEEAEKDEKTKGKRAGLSLVKELEPEQVNKLEEAIERKLNKIANANKKKKESQGEHVKSMLQRVLGLDVEQYMEYGVREFREVLEEMGQSDIGHSIIKGMIDRYGKDNKIDNPKIHAMVQKVILVREYLRGTEEPDDLDKRQLSELIYMSKFHQRTYRPSDAAHHHAKEPPQERLRKAQEERELELKDNVHKMNNRESDLTKKKEELREVLLSRAKEMETRGELVIPEAQWVGATKQERHAINRVGFLIYSYRCKYWWYEIADMLRKLIMITITVFGFDGTVSQVALGMMVTVMYLLLALIRQPYRNRTLGIMNLFSLSVQSITFFYGIILATGELDELAGEKGSTQRRITGVIVTILNCILILIPIFDLCVEILPGRYFIRQLLVQWGGLSKEAAGIKKEEDTEKIKQRTVEEVKPHAQAQFHLLTLKTFLKERRAKTNGMYDPDPNEEEATMAGYVPPNATLVFSDDAARSGALARWVPTMDPEIEEEVLATARSSESQNDPERGAREISFTPIKAARHDRKAGVDFVDKEKTTASQQRLAAETLKMQEAFKAAAQPYLTTQQASGYAYSLKPPEEEEEAGAAAAGAAEQRGSQMEAAQLQKAAERRQVLEETLAELPEGSESRAQVEQMLALLSEAGAPAQPAGAAGGEESMPPTVNPYVEGELGFDLAAARVESSHGEHSQSHSKHHHHHHHAYHQKHANIHDTTIQGTSPEALKPESFPFQTLFGDGMTKVDPNSFILKSPDSGGGASKPREPAEVELKVERGKEAKEAKRVHPQKKTRMGITLTRKKARPQWPAQDQSDDEEEAKGSQKDVVKDRTAVLEADLVTPSGGGSEAGAASPARSAAGASSQQNMTTATQRQQQYFSRINVPLPHMHHHELLGADATADEETLAVGGHSLAPANMQARFHAPGLLVLDDEDSGAGVMAAASGKKKEKKVKGVHT